MTPGSSMRDGEIEALVVDRYLDSLLARAPHDVIDLPDDLRTAADRLVTRLPRYHPSFRFEEALAARLAAVAVGLPNPGAVIDFPRSDRRAQTGRGQAPPDERSGQVHPVVIGGVVTSAAISLAAAWMAWRRGRPPVGPMTRAVRAVAKARLV